MSSYHGWTHAPKEQGGTDPIPISNAAAPAWIAVYDNFVYGQPLSTATGFEDVLFPFLQVGDPGGDTYSWQAIDGSPILGSNWTYKPQILKDGVYSFTLQWWSENEVGNNNSELRYLIDLNAHWPGRVNSTPYVHMYFYRDYNGYAANYEWNQRTVVLPVQPSSFGGFPALVDVQVALLRQSADADFTDVVTHSLWITRIGDIGISTDVEANDDPGPP